MSKRKKAGDFYVHPTNSQADGRTTVRLIDQLIIRSPTMWIDPLMGTGNTRCGGGRTDQPPRRRSGPEGELYLETWGRHSALSASMIDCVRTPQAGVRMYTIHIRAWQTHIATRQTCPPPWWPPQNALTLPQHGIKRLTIASIFFLLMFLCFNCCNVLLIPAHWNKMWQIICFRNDIQQKREMNELFFDYYATRLQKCCIFLLIHSN